MATVSILRQYRHGSSFFSYTSFCIGETTLLVVEFLPYKRHPDACCQLGPYYRFVARFHPSLRSLIHVICLAREERRVGIPVLGISLVAAASEAPSTTVRHVLHFIISCNVPSCIRETGYTEQAVAHELRDSKDSSSKARPTRCAVAGRATQSSIQRAVFDWSRFRDEGCCSKRSRGCFRRRGCRQTPITTAHAPG